MQNTPAELATEVLALSNIIKPLLSGRDPGVIGGTLADLVSLYIAGHHPALRHEVEVEWIKTMRAMIAPSVSEIAELHGGLPDGWGKQ